MIERPSLVVHSMRVLTAALACGLFACAGRSEPRGSDHSEAPWSDGGWRHGDRACAPGCSGPGVGHERVPFEPPHEEQCAPECLWQCDYDGCGCDCPPDEEDCAPECEWSCLDDLCECDCPPDELVCEPGCELVCVVDYECECECRSAACFLLIDEDGIDNGLAPNYFDDVDVNDSSAAIGLRAQLDWFARHVGEVIELWSGQVGDEGWFTMQTIPSAWASAGPTSDGLRNFVGLPVGPGLGSPAASGDRESLLDEIPGVTPLRASGLSRLVGRDVCALVYDSDISIDYDPLTGNLMGANLGLVAFRVLTVDRLYGESSSSLPVVTVEVLDADTVCREVELCEELPQPTSSSTPFDTVPE